MCSFVLGSKKTIVKTNLYVSVGHSYKRKLLVVWHGVFQCTFLSVLVRYGTLLPRLQIRKFIMLLTT